MWPDLKPARAVAARRTASWMMKGRRSWLYATPFANPIAGAGDIAQATVVYPETISGNPLKAANVARWLLHRPAFHTGETVYGKDDLFVFHEHAFNSLDLPETHRLSLTYINPTYLDCGQPRSGTCYLLRKGAGRTISHSLEGSTKVDGLTHAETAAVFNRTRLLFSYDPFTMYNHYAAMCGCTPIIIPPDGMTADEWLPDIDERAGIAWGEDDIERAIATRPDLFKRLERRRQQEDAMVDAFARRARTFRHRSHKT